MLLEQPGRHPVSVIMVFTALLLFGIVSYGQLNLEELPEISVPYINVVCEYPAFPPDEIEQLLTIPLENALSGVKGVKDMTSLSGDGLSSVSLRFDWDADMDEAALDVREAIDSVYPYLPEGVSKPLVFKENLSDKPVMKLVCFPAEGVEPDDLYIPVKYELANRLREIQAIGRIRLRGLRKPEIHIRTDMEQLYELNLSVSELGSRIGQYIIDLPVGKISESGRERLVRIDSKLTDPSDLGELPLQDGSSLTVGDIAAVRWETEDPTSLFFHKGKAAISLELYKSGSAGTVEAAARIRELLPELNELYKDRFTLIVLKDSSRSISRSVSSLLISLFLGLTAAAGVLFFLYRGIGIPGITALTIPLTLIILFFILYILDISLNLVSLLGMIIGIGLIADNTIIVLEALNENGSCLPEESGRILKGISPAVFSSSLTTVLVFLPPLFLPGAVSVLFRDLIFTVTALIILSFFVSHFFAPACFFLLRPLTKEGERRGKSCSFLITGEKRYKQQLGASLDLSPKGRLLPRGVYLLILCFAVFMVVILPHELLPESGNREYTIEISLPGEWDVDRIGKECVWLTAQLEQFVPQGRISISAGYEKDSLRDRSRPACHLHKLDISLAVDKGNPFPESGELKQYLTALGYPKVQLRSIRNSVETALLPSMARQGNETRPVLRFSPHDKSLQASGWTAAALQQELCALIQGIKAGEVPYDREKIAIRIRADEKYRSTPDAIRRIRLKKGDQWSLLDDLIQVEQTREERELIRENRGNGAANANLFDKGVFLRLYAFALILIFLVLGIQTESLKRASLLMLSLPVSLAGSLIFLGIFRYSLNIYSFMGILILQGTIINTGILLLDGLKGGDRAEVLRVSSRRIRPVAATTGTTVCALVPVLFQSLLRGDATGGMAAAVIGGMLTGTPLILYYIPLFHYQMTRREAITE